MKNEQNILDLYADGNYRTTCFSQRGLFLTFCMPNIYVNTCIYEYIANRRVECDAVYVALDAVYVVLDAVLHFLSGSHNVCSDD